MTDRDAILRELILAQAEVTEIIGTRAYIATDPPTGYNPNPLVGAETVTGSAVLFTPRGGRPNATSVYADLTYQARCYGATEAIAKELDASLYHALHQRSRGVIRLVHCTVLGQHVPLPEIGWHTYLSTWSVIAVTASSPSQ